MKTLYVWLTVASLGSLSACTVNYYGVPPGGPGRPPRTTVYNSRDSVYVGGGSTTVVNQPGVVGAPTGGYATGPGVHNPPPPRGGYYGQPNGGNPPRGGYGNNGNNGGSGNGPSRGTVGSSTPAPTKPGSVSATAPAPTKIGSVSATTPAPTKISSVSATTPAPTKVGTVGSSTPTSPVKTPATGGGSLSGGGNNSGGDVTLADGTGGEVKPPVRIGGIKPEPPVADEPPIRTGGIKPEPPVTVEAPVRTGIRTGGIKPARGGTSLEDAPGRVVQEQQLGAGPGRVRPTPATAPTDGDVVLNDKNVEPTNVVVRGGNLAAATPALVFAKPGCRGTCPSYTATVWANGRVQYVGQQNVPRIGTIELTLPAGTVASWQQQAQGIGFWELQERYASGVTDIPGMVLTMYRAKGNKTVTVEDAAPEQVQALFSRIDNEISQLAAGGTDGRPSQSTDLNGR